MREAGVPVLRRWLMWAGVRWGVECLVSLVAPTRAEELVVRIPAT